MKKENKNNEDVYNSKCKFHEKLIAEFNQIEEQKIELNNQYQKNQTNYVFSEERKKNFEKERTEIIRNRNVAAQKILGL